MSVELKVRTNYSFLRGGSSPEEIIREASRLGTRAVAITDLHGVYAIPKAWRAIADLERENQEQDAGHRIPKLLCGAELILQQGEDQNETSVVLIARDRPAYGALCRILTEAQHGGAEKEKGKAFLPLARFLRLMKGVEIWNQGFYPRTKGLFLFPQWEDAWSTSPHWRDEERSILGLTEKFSWVREFPSDQIYLPLSRAIDGRDEIRTLIAKALQRNLSPEEGGPLQIVAHNDVHYHEPRRRAVQDVLTCIREGVTLKEAGFRLQSNTERHLKSPQVMKNLFADLPEAHRNADRIADACVFLPSELRYRYPSEWIPPGHTAQAYLESLCAVGLRERYRDGPGDGVEKQLAHELQLIAQLGFADYFLTVYDIVKFARDQNILCQGRGSAANSIVCYVLGITAIDPVRMNLLFERFISVERGEPPDIDVDFEHERREEVIQYIYEKYGRDRAAMVSAVVTYRRRSALRETAKVMGLPVGSLSAKRVERELLAPAPVGVAGPELRAKIHHIADTISGFPRHLSIHSGGFTLSADPITEIVPVEPASMEGRTIIQWDKYDLDILGLLKIDVLALGMLTAIQKNLGLIGKKLHEIPAEDPATYAMIQKADTIGTFQIESRAQMAMLPRLKPKCFYDLVVEVALVRPGPIVGKMVHPYLKRRRGEESAALPDPRLEPILGRTLGVPIFQEQVMKIAVALAGFTPGEADRLRRAIGAWRSQGSIDEMGRKLMAGLMREGIPREFADRIFEQIQGFSEYGFPESHAASFALIAYVSCYLKCHHPAEFLVAMLNSQPLGFYAPHTLVDDAKRHGVRVLPVSLHHSKWESEYLGDKTVRVGFHLVHGMSRDEYDSLAEARPFQSLHDLVSRTRIRSNVLRTLALGDVFRELVSRGTADSTTGLNQREALWQLLSLELPLRNCRLRAPSQAFQLSLFASEEVKHDLFSSVSMESMDGYEEVLSDYRAFGLSHRTHPMTFVRQQMGRQIPDMDTRRAREQPNGRAIQIPGLSLVLQRPPTAGGTAFATLEDEFGFLDLIIRREVYEKIKETVMEEPFITVRGMIQRDGDSVSLIVRGVGRFLPQGDEILRASHEKSTRADVRLPNTPGSIARQFY